MRSKQVAFVAHRNWVGSAFLATSHLFTLKPPSAAEGPLATDFVLLDTPVEIDPNLISAESAT